MRREVEGPRVIDSEEGRKPVRLTVKIGGEGQGVIDSEEGRTETQGD